MKLAYNAKLSELRYVMREVLKISDQVYKEFRRKEGATLTYIRKGIHSPGSYHPYGFAMDLRINFMLNKWTKNTKIEVFNTIRHRLKHVSEFFDVVLEKTHIHIEFDLERFLNSLGISEKQKMVFRVQIS